MTVSCGTGKGPATSERGDGGWMLLQMLLAFAVLGTLSITIMDLLGRSSEATHLAWETDLAAALAESQLELLRATEAGSIAVGEGQPLLIGTEALANLPFGEGSVDVLQEDGGLLRVRARVAWGPRPRRRAVKLETLVALPAEKE